MDCASFSLHGPKGRNDDYLLEPIQSDGVICFAVADGVGGSPDGGRVAQLAIEKLQQIFELQPRLSYGAIFDRLKEQVIASGLDPSAATTLSVVRLEGNLASVGHVGDTRIYHFRGRGILTRTQDQTEIAELVRRGVFSRHEAANYPRKNVLTSALSARGDLNLFESQFTVQKGDALFGCTDGVYNVLSKIALRDILANSPAPSHFIESVKAQVEKAGIVDDTSGIAVKI